MHTGRQILYFRQYNIIDNMTTIYSERVARLREMMAVNGWDAVVIGGSDPHSSEYPTLPGTGRRNALGCRCKYLTQITLLAPRITHPKLSEEPHLQPLGA